MEKPNNVPRELERKILTAIAVLSSKNASVEARARSWVNLLFCELELKKLGN